MKKTLIEALNKFSATPSEAKRIAQIMGVSLRLPLKHQWFEMTKSGVKTEDYREINEYWCNRLLLYMPDGESKSKLWLKKEFFDEGTFEERIENIDLFCFFKKFATNTMTLGYPKSADTERILTLEHKGIEIRKGNPEWGAEPNKLYFVIKHGKILK